MKFIYKLRNRTKIDDFNLNMNDIYSAKSILFTFFGRYGECIIGFNGALDIVKQFPDKEYIFITSPQNFPYFQDQCSAYGNCNVYSLKKNNFFKLLFIIFILKIKKIDLGFNPFSWSDESEFLITFTRRFKFFKNYDLGHLDNYYNIVKKYFTYKRDSKIEISNFSSINMRKVLICPESSESRRSLTQNQLDKIISTFKDKEIIVAHSGKRYHNIQQKQFIFRKKRENSIEFIDILKKQDMMICVDSAPMHLGFLYEIPMQGYFSSSTPARVVKNKSLIQVFRHEKLKNLMCEKKDCIDAKCMISHKYKLENLDSIKIVNKCMVD